ncbi:hypothetical protein H5410_009837 [Solanum commersonii]|uniref:Endonuclease/exonuclease/phosphatase domain-containing protein n=1 Tax=Solanum commersonii TaxID=4109 RepID=A0A9J6AJX0_SOLCO|nr:hypothetical protein H5410_009837 [Solanum commersonii]
MVTQVDGGERILSCIQTEPVMMGTQQTSHEKGRETSDTQSTDYDMQLQHIHDVEPVNIQLPNSQEDCETEASNWVNSHILDLSNTYGVAFEGFEREIIALLMKIDERKTQLDKKGKGKAVSTPKSRGIGKNELKNLKSSLNEENKRTIVKSLMKKWKADVYCLQETKISKDLEAMAKQLWSCRWMKCGYLEAEGSCGGILLLWDSRIWIYAPHTRIEKLICWEELAPVRTLCEGPWITCGDFNTNRTMGEKRGCNRISYVMSDFSRWIEEMELHDPHLNGGKFSWFRGINHPSAARLDRFLYSMEWEEKFKNIRQKLLPRVLSDHCPILLESGNWEQKRSNFKFENWWLKVEGFTNLIQSWWNEFLVEGCPDYRLNIKLRMLKQKLKEWSKSNFGELTSKKNSLLEELAEIDLIQETRELSEDEVIIRATIVVELEELAKNEELKWKQKGFYG